MGRYETMFDELKARHEGAFVPFCVVGDPTIDTSLAAIRALVGGGADALELGVPFSDPIADGPAIQAAAQRAIAAGATAARCFEAIAQLRAEGVGIPIGILTYANVVAADPGAFYAAAASAGVDSVLLADVPTVEATPFAAAAHKAGVHNIMIAPPNADEAQLTEIAKLTSGYTYVVTRSGVTGADESIGLGRADLIERLGKLGAPPPLMGFGISRPSHVRAALDAGAAGAISGSAVVGIIAEYGGDEVELAGRLTKFVQDMKLATLYKG